ncbi:MAG: hypothetical protein KDA84_28170, partial [Planctomycetaceae bacterium]|nr:hypothetical protein [Planctomycetaceae bacterium]
NRPMTARLVDLDGQIFGDPKPVLEQLLTQPLTCPTAVHGYSLDEKTIAELSRRGIMVFRRLDDYVCNVLLDLSMQNSDQPRSPHRIESEDSVSV